jgi:hypothetical protein
VRAHHENRAPRKSRPIATLILPTICLVSLLCQLLPASAASSLERVALQFNGSPCGAQYPHIVSALFALSGVRAVDLSTVPDHALVDIDRASLSAQNLVETVRGLWHNQDACHVEAIQSCISAGPLAHVGGPPADRAPMH